MTNETGSHEVGAPLTPREEQVREYLCLGWTNKEIADALDVSPRTVEDHRFNVLKKYGARNCVELVRTVYGIERFGPNADKVLEPAE